MTDRLTGRCHCGGVTFSLPAGGSAVACHCSVCRRSTGAPFILVTAVAPDDARIDLDGVELISRSTSPYLSRHRCSRCGAAIYNAIRTRKGAAFDNFSVPLLDRPERVPLSHHIYYADRVLDIDDGRPRFDAWGRP